jgi:hypothetical protein
VVVVGVRDQHRRDRLRRTAHLGKGGEHLLAISWVARVDQGDDVPLGEDHPVGVAPVHQIGAVGDLLHVRLHDRPE